MNGINETKINLIMEEYSAWTDSALDKSNTTTDEITKYNNIKNQLKQTI